MNEVTGVDVPKALPRILRDFGLACHRARVDNQTYFEEFAARYFAERAGYDVSGTSAAERENLRPAPIPDVAVEEPQPPISRDPPAPLPQEVIRSPIKPQQPPRSAFAS